MRNKILYVYTENLNFFYKLNNELKRLNIRFKILNIDGRLPYYPSLILTTSEDDLKFKNFNENVKLIKYFKDDNFYYYILKVLAAYRIYYRDYYSKLTFSIDPGTKHIGLVIFLDDYFLNSHTIYDKKSFIVIIKDYVTCFQKKNSNLIELTFKFGRGILPMTLELVKEIYDAFESRNKLKVFLIDESRSSKIKIQDIKKRKMSKHEVSALILAFRKGIEINDFNIIKQNKLQKSNNQENIETQNEEINESLIDLREIIEKVLDNEISLSKSIKMLKTDKFWF
ncbi:MAG: hypothetical protein ACFE9T_05540 [Promethearchaeota archaeon]